MKKRGILRGISLVLLLLTVALIAGSSAAEPAEPDSSTADMLNVEKVGYWSAQNVIDINVLGNEAYVARYFYPPTPASGHFSTVDVEEPANPQEIIADRLDANYDEIFHAGYADEILSYLAEDEINGLSPQFQVFGKVNKQLVCFTPSYNTRTVKIWAAGSYYFIAVAGQAVGADNGLLVFTPTPIAPYNTCTRIDKIETSGEVTAAAAHGAYAYLGTTDGTLSIIDIANPLFPTLKSNVKFFDGRIEAIAAAQGIVYLGQGSEIKIIDASSPTAPVEVHDFTVAESVLQMATAGDYVYLLSQHALDVIDVQDSDQPTSAGYYIDEADGRFGNALYLANDLIYTGGPQGMNILRFTPGEPAQLILQPNTAGVILNGQEMPFPCQLPGLNRYPTGGSDLSECPEGSTYDLVKLARDASVKLYVDCPAGFIELVAKMLAIPHTNWSDRNFAQFTLAGIVLGRFCEEKAESHLLEGARGTGSFAAAGPDLVLEHQQGPVRYQVAEELLALEIQTETATIHSCGANDFSVVHLPDTIWSEIACYQGPVEVDPANASLSNVTLNSGQQVEVTAAQISPVTDIMAQTYIPMIASKANGGTVDGWQIIFQEDFEGSFPGSWTVFDDLDGYGDYHWAKRNCRSFAGNHSAWAVGGGADGRALPCGSIYPDSAMSWMIYGPFNLAGATAAEMSFEHWLNTGTASDRLFWGASTDGSYFTGWQQWGTGNGWQRTVFDLSNVPGGGSMAGKASVWVAFVFASDGSTNSPEGAYIDNILLRKFVPR